MMYGLLTIFGKKRKKASLRCYRVYWYFENQHDPIRNAGILASSSEEAGKRLRTLIAGYIKTPVEIVAITDEGAPNE